MPTSNSQFIENLKKSGLFNKEQLQSILKDLESQIVDQAEDARLIAHELVRKQVLTPYQATILYQGKLGNLFIGNYDILGRIGAGGMGAVFKARHRVMRRIVAIKVLPRRVVNDRNSVQRFRREVQTAAQLQHPNIVTAFDADEANRTHFLVMECVDGQDLGQFVRQKGPLSIRDAMHCIVQAARGLEHAHNKGVIHRDVKPSNLLLDVTGTVKVLDMGLARVTADEALPAQSSLTSTGAVMGTIDFMAPEQAVDSKHVDQRADIYGLGCTLYYLLTGKKPYGGDSIMQVLLAHREQPIPSLREARPEVSQRLDALYQKMVSKNASDRYPSMTSVIDALQLLDVEPQTDDAPALSVVSVEQSALEEFQQFLDGQDSPPLSLGPTLPNDLTSTITMPTTLGNRNRQMLAGLVLATMLTVGLAYWLFAGRSSESADSQTQVSGNQAEKGIQKPVSVTEPFSTTPKAPPFAIAPFDAEQAKSHQEVWAKHLGVPVEYTNSIGMKFRLIPPGEFLMGLTPEEVSQAIQQIPKDDRLYEARNGCLEASSPRHRVILTNPFYFGIYEVTQSQYQQVMGENPSTFSPSGSAKYVVAGMDTDRFPVDNVSWRDAVDFCARLSDKKSAELNPQIEFHYRLPTEAEWEFACRAGTTSAHWFGDDESALATVAWVSESKTSTCPVSSGQLRANPFGLHEMTGNVFEWCTDSWDPKFYEQFVENAAINPIQNKNIGIWQINRGGAWHTPVYCCRSGSRNSGDGRKRVANCGFRAVLEVRGTK
jgi:eukaryotic-like serine/threonine-protein kinase